MSWTQLPCFSSRHPERMLSAALKLQWTRDPVASDFLGAPEGDFSSRFCIAGQGEGTILMPHCGSGRAKRLQPVTERKRGSQTPSSGVLVLAPKERGTHCPLHIRRGKPGRCKLVNTTFSAWCITATLLFFLPNLPCECTTLGMSKSFLGTPGAPCFCYLAVVGTAWGM